MAKPIPPLEDCCNTVFLLSLYEKSLASLIGLIDVFVSNGQTVLHFPQPTHLFSSTMASQKPFSPKVIKIVLQLHTYEHAPQPQQRV